MREYIFLELSNICNFHCAYCPSDALTRPRGLMDTSLARRLIDEVAEGQMARRVAFHIMGEPLLHPACIDLCAYATQKGLPVDIFTNGARLRKRVIDALLDAGISRLVVSLETPDEESFQLRRTKVISFDRYIRQIQDLILAKIETKAPTQIVIETMNTSDTGRHGMKGTISAIDDKAALVRAIQPWIAFAQRVQQDYDLPLPPSFHAFASLSPEKAYFYEVFELLPQVFIQLKRFISWGNTKVGSPKVYPALVGTCDAFRSQVGVLWDGRVVPCCNDYDGRVILGDVNHQSLSQVLASPRATKVRRGLNWCLLTEPFCRQCRGGPTLRSALVNQLGSIAVYKLGVHYFTRPGDPVNMKGQV